MSSLVKYGKVYHYQWYEHGLKRSKTLKTGDLSRAKTAQKILDGRIASGDRSRDPGKAEIAVEIENYLSYKDGLVKRRSVEIYRHALKNLRLALGDEKITLATQLSPEVISRALGRLKTEIGCKLPGPIYQVWKSFARWLCDQEKTKTLVSAKWPRIKSFPADPGRLGSYTVDEIRKIREAIKGDALEPVFMVGLFLGCRAEEIGLMEVGHINFSAGVVSVRNAKTDGSTQPFRPVSIHDELRPVLVGLCEGNPHDAPLFPGLYYPALGSKFKRVCKRAGVTYRRFHGLRHTFISHLLQAGCSIYQVMQIAGHRKITTTERYLHQVSGLADVSKLKF